MIFLYILWISSAAALVCASEHVAVITDIGPLHFSIVSPGLKTTTNISSDISLQLISKTTHPCLIQYSREYLCDEQEIIYPGSRNEGLCEGDDYNQTTCVGINSDPYDNECTPPNPQFNCFYVTCKVQSECYQFASMRLGNECAPGFYCNQNAQCVDAAPDTCPTELVVSVDYVLHNISRSHIIYDEADRAISTLLVLKSGFPIFTTVVISPSTVPAYTLSEPSDPDLNLVVNATFVYSALSPGDLFPVFIDYYYNLTTFVYSHFVGYAIYAPVPILYTLCPGTALAFVANDILVNGAGFYNSTFLSCFFNNVSVPVRYIDTQRVICTVTPADSAAGVVSLSVSNDGVQQPSVPLRVLGACNTIKPGSIVVDSTCVCPAGSYDTGAFCQLCADGFYQPASGQSLCIPCGPSRTTLRLVGSLSEAACVCADGFFAPDPVAAPEKCVACAAGMVCFNGTVDVAPGYWRAESGSVFLLPCPLTLNGERCQGGAGAGDDVCADGYEGPLCSVCARGYGNVGPSECTPCNGKGADASVVALLFVLGCVAVAALVRVSAEPEKGVSGSVGSVLKIILNYTQIVFYIGTLSARWSPETISFFNIFLPMSISPTFISVKCVSELSFEARTALVIAAPVLLALLVLAFMVVAYAFVPERILRWLFPVNANTYVMTLLIVLYTVHPMLAASTFEALDCTAVPGPGGGRYVTADMSVDCDTAGYKRVRLAAALFVVIYIFGGPAYVMRRMWLNHAGIIQAQQCTVNFEADPACRYLYAVRGYKSDTFLWEAVVLFRKLAIVAAAALISEGLQLAWCGAILMISFCLTLQWKPFVRLLDNRLEIVAHMALGVSVLLAFHSYFLRDSGAAILVVLIATNTGAFALMVVSTVARMRKPIYEFLGRSLVVMRLKKRRSTGDGDIRMYERGGTVAELDSKMDLGDGWDFDAKI